MQFQVVIRLLLQLQIILNIVDCDRANIVTPEKID